MRVRAKHGGHAAVEMPAQRLFFRGRLGMDLNQRAVELPGEFLEQSISRKERAIGLRPHEAAAEHRADEQAETVFFHDNVVAPRAGRRQVGRTADAVEGLDFLLEALLIPHVVAERDDINAGLEERLADGARDARTRRGVLGVGDDKVDAPSGAHFRHEGGDDVAPGLADDVADEEELHELRGEVSRTRGVAKARRAQPRSPAGFGVEQVEAAGVGSAESADDVAAIGQPHAFDGVGRGL